MSARLILLLFCFTPSCLTTWGRAQEIDKPRVLIPGWEIELVLSEPDIVTPTACSVDRSGRLLVVECHTHFPPDDYDGPKIDQIYALTDTDGDGRLDRQTTYYPGGTATMGIASLDDGSVIVVSRAQVTRHWDEDGNGIADKREVLLRLKTKAVYPHNGLGGIAVAHDGSLLIGQGENFGEAYELVAADGSRQVGSGEGGNIFRMTADGKQLERVATGFWNPFGICVDNAGRIWTVGNDPDAMPPCRLLHVVEGGDYGFQFRFGRGGRHPLQAWNGELPGTLPYVAGTGEAAGGIARVDDRLWVTSWGDNRIEAYRLSPRSSSWSSETQVVVQGGPNFRPVGITRAPDGSVYLTDWVDRSYNVHRKGRVWRLRPTESAPSRTELPPFSASERRAQEIVEAQHVSTLLDALNGEDPFVRQRAMAALAKSKWLQDIPTSALQSERQRAGVLAAWRWRELSQPDSVAPETRRRLIRQTLSQPHVAPQLIALRWAAERDDKELVPQIESLLQEPTQSPDLFPAIIASASYLRKGTASSGVRDPAREQLVIAIAGDEQHDATIRTLALRMIPTESELPTSKQLSTWLGSTASLELHREIIRLLHVRGTPDDLAVLAQLADDENLPAETRADAMVGLTAEKHQIILRKLAQSTAPAVAREARRMLRDGIDTNSLPEPSDVDTWLKLAGTGGDASAGQRVFWRMTCSRCHAHQGRGATTGPELTSLKGQTRRRLLESILSPGKEVGPTYAPWHIVTTDGRQLLGLKSSTAGVGESMKFQGVDGNEFEVPLEQVESQILSDQSIMPDGLEKTMAVAELRDLLAFLESEASE